MIKSGKVKNSKITQGLVSFCFLHQNTLFFSCQSLDEKYPYSELFWSVFSSIWTEYGELRNISPYSVRMPENTDQNNTEYGHFLRSGFFSINLKSLSSVLYIFTGFHRSSVVISITASDSKNINRDPKAYSEPCQTCEIELFINIVNGCEP